VDDVTANELSAFSRAVLGMLQRALPFQHCPAGVVVLRQLREDRAEIDLTVTERAKTTGPAEPITVAAIDPLASVRAEFASLTWKDLMRK